MKCITCGIDMSKLGDVSFICKNCSLISNKVTPDYSIYDKSYHTKYVRYSSTSIGLKLNQLRAAFTLNAQSSIDSKVLDFGCGSGSFVEYYKSLGHSINGFDINSESSFCRVENLFDNYDTVTFWDSIEHLVDPVKVLQGLSPKNILISTPSTDDFEGELKDIHKWHHFYIDEHIHNFNETSLKYMLRSLGYEIRHVSYSESNHRTSGGDKNIVTIVGRKL